MGEKLVYGYKGWDFSDGKVLSDEKIKKTIEQVISTLRETENSTYFIIRSGRNMVIGTKTEEDGDEIEICVCNDYIMINTEEQYND